MGDGIVVSEEAADAVILAEVSADDADDRVAVVADAEVAATDTVLSDTAEAGIDGIDEAAVG